MAAFEIEGNPTALWLLRMTLDGVLEDVTELSNYLQASADEFHSVRQRGDKFVGGAEALSHREQAILVLDLARRLAERCLAEIDSGEDAAVAVAALTAQGLMTMAAGKCLGLQLGRRADAALARIKSGAAEGGRKGAMTRRSASIDADSAIAAAKKLGWPAQTSGVNKRLSIKFDCTADHIGRILRKALSGM